jgi:trimeric autotransporter adhesin
MATINGTPGNDVLEGTEDTDYMEGFDGDDVLIGNGSYDYLSGGNGSDHLFGGDGEDALDGGAGADIMEGGEGADIYIVDDVNDVVIDSGVNGSDFWIADEIETTVDYTLPDNIEDGTSRNGATITGNDLDNELWTIGASAILRGMGGNDTLIGLSNANTLEGGTGDDYYHLNEFATVVELAGEGVDTINILGSLNYTLQANIENLIIGPVQEEGAAVINGNELDNDIRFYSADQSVRHELNGLAGNDVLRSLAARNAIIANGGWGNDFLIGSGPQPDYGGPLQPDQLFGGEGDDRLYSGGGDDLMDGGSGADRFEVLVGGGNPEIVDFNADEDRIGFREMEDMPLPPVLTPDMVHIGSGATAQTLAHRFIFDTATGAIYYDADGSAGGAQVQIASVNVVGGTVDAGDFYIGPSGNYEVINGTDGDDVIRGTDGRDEIAAGAGNDLVVAEGGRDQVFGGDGNDHLRGSVGSDVLFGEAGNDLLNGSADHDILYGGAGRDELLGQGGDDVLDGGAGADRMEGGDHNDRYVVDNANDVVVETGTRRSTFDVVEAHRNWTLGANLEGLVLAGDARVGTGNGLDNTIEGNEHDNTLRALGGDDEVYGRGGDDTLDGGNGDDSLVGGSGMDTLNGGAGTDILRGTDDWWDSEDDGVRDVLNGGSGNDELYAGANDHLAGGDGDDVYHQVRASNTLSEGSGGGIDLVEFSDGSYTLGANFENLQLGIESETLSGSFQAVGNSLSNVIDTYNNQDDVHITALGLGGNDHLYAWGSNQTADGGTGNDYIYVDGSGITALGGSGNDRLETADGGNSFTGGTGADRFMFSFYNDTGVSTVTDFDGAQDTLELLAGAFAGLDAVGPLSAAAFHAGTAATTADQRLIYDASAGALYYDSDGNGMAAQELILNLTVANGTFDYRDIEIAEF